MSTSASILKTQRRARKRKKKALRKLQVRKGINQSSKPALPNRNCPWKTPEEEQSARQAMVEATLKVFRPLLSGLMADLAKIPDPRNPRKTKHKLTVLLLYGLFAFVFHYSSRREAGREMSRPVFFENLKQLFPELESLPHQDTLCRLLEKIEVDEIETAHINLLRRLIRNKKFVVVCEEKWEEVSEKGDIVTKTSRHAWISSEPISQKNVHTRCNLMGRKRWGIENDILQEKEQGYQYEHVFSHDWNAMKGYHYLMHLAHLLNELAQSSIDLAKQVQEVGIRGFVRLLRETISGPWLNKERIELLGKKYHQLRLIA